MRQFDVVANPGRTKAEQPYFVIVQSSRFSAAARRMIIPLVRCSSGAMPMARVNPVFTVGGIDVFLDTLELTNVPVGILGPPVATLAEHGEAIIAAIDEVISRAYD